MPLSIVIDEQNAAFADGDQVRECVRILRMAADRLEAENPDCQLPPIRPFSAAASLELTGGLVGNGKQLTIDIFIERIPNH